MQKTDSIQSAHRTHRKVQVSTTLNRKYVRKPVSMTAKASATSTPVRRSIRVGQVSGAAVQSNAMTKQASQTRAKSMTGMVSPMTKTTTTQIKKTTVQPAPKVITRSMTQTMTKTMPQQASQTISRPAAKSTAQSMTQASSQRKISRYNDSFEQIEKFYQQSVAQKKETVKQEEMKHIPHPIQKTVSEKMNRRKVQFTERETPRISGKEMKEKAIQKALVSAASVNMDQQPEKKQKMHFGFGRVVLALACTAAAVFAIVYFVNLNMPDISLRVAAMQTGIEASYPSYVPRDYSLSNIVSENGKISLNFVNSAANDEFSLVEEQSSWDSTALLNNYVKEAFGDDYVTIREQGLTIYIDGSNAAWVNGGVMYTLKAKTGSLTKKQIKAIAVSL